MPSTTDTTGQPPAVAEPRHKLPELTTYELRGYRCDLEQAIAWFDRQDPVPAVRDRLHAALAAVIAEQDDRARIARAR